MASVETPDLDYIVEITGLNRFIQWADESQFQAATDALIPRARARIALAVGSAFSGSAWSEDQAEALKQAWAYRMGAMALNPAWLQYATGTQEPLLMDPDEIEAVRAIYISEARELETLAGQETESDRPFSLPAVAAGTFTPLDSDRTPSERIELWDETDDRSDWVLE